MQRIDAVPEQQRERFREDAQFRVAENYLLSGLGRHAPDEDIDLAARSLFALSVQLGDKPYLMGDEPCGTDATAFGAIAGIAGAVIGTYSGVVEASSPVRQPYAMRFFRTCSSGIRPVRCSAPAPSKLLTIVTNASVSPSRVFT